MNHSIVSNKQIINTLLSRINPQSRVLPPQQVIEQAIRLKEKDPEKTLQYQLFFVYQSLKGLIRKQSIKAVTDKLYLAPFQINPGDYPKWKNTFSVPQDDIPFGMYLKSSAPVFLKLMKELGLNLKNVLHLRHHISLSKPGLNIEAGNYENLAWVKSIIPVGRKNAIVTIISNVLDAAGTKMVEVTDYFMVLNVNKKDMDFLRTQPVSEKVNYRAWRNIPKLESEALVAKKKMNIPEKMGLTYGKLSGDCNIVHTTKTCAKIFGFKGAFIQGLCTTNYVLANCPDYKNINDFSINFVKPVYTGKSIKMEYCNSAFRVLDENNNVLAHGAYG